MEMKSKVFPIICLVQLLVQIYFIYRNQINFNNILIQYFNLSK